MNKTSEPNEIKCEPRILIVDNDSRFTHSASELLQDSCHCMVCEENDPRRALETARSFKPDLILMDLIMPEADGTEIAAQIKSDWTLHGVPIVFVTALITREEARDMRRIDGHRIVPKPVSNSELIKVVEENLPRRWDKRDLELLKSSRIPITRVTNLRPIEAAQTRAVGSRRTINDGRSIQNILIYDNDPVSLRLLREVYLGSTRSSLSQYYLPVIALLIVALVVGIIWLV